MRADHPSNVKGGGACACIREFLQFVNLVIHI